MNLIGTPFVIQNTDGPDWLVTWDSAIAIASSSGQISESVSFTVAIPKRADISISEVQRYAIKRAIELLQETQKPG